MASRLAGRVLTSPIAFLMAGIADVLLYALGALRRHARAELGAQRRRARGEPPAAILPAPPPTAPPRRRESAS